MYYTMYVNGNKIVINITEEGFTLEEWQSLPQDEKRKELDTLLKINLIYSQLYK